MHKFLGNGFQEVIYQRALAWEMRQLNLDFAREIEQEIFYKDLPRHKNLLNSHLKERLINPWNQMDSVFIVYSL